ncbi:MAG: 16S rRNA (cytidine(1402)-2'-O)-methyltransferase [Lachnospiraceae bacterium]|nr:16S rRNA (cytidine(1402)-2'-O)-methyltransferase [Lachnospiraceae bacterium]
MQGVLYLVATPIGNLEDMTMRAIRVLKEVDLIAAEDTRNSIKLLNHFDIKTHMTSYHEYNKVEKAEVLVNKMLDGENVAIITDAGTPAISDPGEVLVKKAIEAGIKVTSLPGACAAVTALTISGQLTRRFAFEAFLPSDKKERAIILSQMKDETRTMIVYEAPHHLIKTLKELREIFGGDRSLTIVKELTKLHENSMMTTFDDCLAYYEEHEPKGEYVLVIAGKDYALIKADEQAKWEAMSIEEHMEYYMSEGIDKKEAMKKVAKDRGVGKREIYKALISED